MKKPLFAKRALLFFVVGLLILLSACTPTTEMQTRAVETSTFSIEIVDQADRTVTIENIPEKIVSLAPSNTEIMYALGLEDRLVGVTEFCNYPEAAKTKPQVGGYKTVDIEKVVEIQPDLILATNIHVDEVIPELERLGLTAIVLDPTTIDEIIESISLIGRATNKEDEASQLVNNMKARIKIITDKTKSLTGAERPRVFYVLWHDPLTTVGPDTRIHELIVKAGGESIASDLDEDYPTMSLEAVILADPQVIIADSGHGTGSPIFDFVSTEARFSEVSARQNDRVYVIESDLTTRPTPRIVEGLEEMAKMIHPEIFGSN